MAEANKENEPDAVEEAGQLLAQLKYMAENNQGDDLRKDIYMLAREGKLTTGLIVVLRMLRNEENKYAKR